MYFYHLCLLVVRYDSDLALQTLYQSLGLWTTGVSHNLFPLLTISVHGHLYQKIRIGKQEIVRNDPAKFFVE
jgi:hypothetical protein